MGNLTSHRSRAPGDEEGNVVADPGAARGVLTFPNAVSLVRLLGIPLFLWLCLVERNDIAAFGVLMVSGVTDWLDGYLARRLDQESALGALLDPVADRLYIFSVVTALALRDFVPWWVAVALPLRDLMLWSLLPFLKSRGRNFLPVHFLGKAATFNLLYAFPLLLLGGGSSSFSVLAEVIGGAFAVWGVALYWWAGLLYVWQVRTLVQQVPPVRRAGAT